MNKAIGVFDSGMGGLTVARELMRILPAEDIVYFGDTARVPYGTKSAETVIRFSLENILFLLRQNVKFVVVACNTASSIALGVIVRYFRVPIIGVIDPGVKQAVAVTRNRRVGIIGTKATVKSGAYEKGIKNLDPWIKVFSASCPLFVPLAENGWMDNKIAFDVAQEYLSPMKKNGVDTLILGCTHYPLLKPVISRVMGKEVILVDSAKQVASEVRGILEREGLLRCGKKALGSHRFFVSDEPGDFAVLARDFLGAKINNVEKVKVG